MDRERPEDLKAEACADRKLSDLRREFSRVKRSWNILSRAATAEALKEAVELVFAEHGRGGKIKKSTLRAAISKHFIHAVLRRARKVKGTTRKSLLLELERSKHSVLHQRNTARVEFEELRNKTAELRSALGREKDVLYPEEERALDRELGEKISDLHRRRMKKGMGFSLDPDSVDELTAFVRDQRRRALSLGLAQEGQAMAILDRRIAKLNTTLERAEHAMRVLAGKSGDRVTAASLFRDLQGLALDSTLDKAKFEILRVLFEENLELQREAAS